ncbi:GL19176 [Drosophila persimilis]|uniref:GL19176 n=1 Tax=Drosophila persimilis TaxID=7234 RepID=B4G7K4_DROPE|nr:GL19176 [Drosophila persimilis]
MNCDNGVIGGRTPDLIVIDLFQDILMNEGIRFVRDINHTTNSSSLSSLLTFLPILRTAYSLRL